MVFATVPAAPPTWKNRRATSWPAPISAKVPYFFASRLIWNAFLLVPTSISAFIRTQDVDICLLLNRRGRFPNCMVPGGCNLSSGKHVIPSRADGEGPRNYSGYHPRQNQRHVSNSIVRPKVADT